MSRRVPTLRAELIRREGAASAEPENDGSELPEGWAASRLGDVASLISGAGFPIDQ